MIQREPIYSALFARLSAIPGIVTASRKLRHWADVPDVEQPAVFLAQNGEIATPSRQAPTKWVLQCDVYVYVKTGGSDSPASVLNPIIDAIEASLAPENAMTQACTLGGLVTHAWIEGNIQTDEGKLGDQAVAIIPVHILVS